MHKLIPVVAAAAVAFATQASALTSKLTIDSISAGWFDDVPDAGVTITNGDPTDRVRWGTSSGSGQSGYDFTRSGVPISNIAVDEVFNLGTFVHLNRPITGTVLESIKLRVRTQGFLVEDPSTRFDLVSVFQFTHDETSNSPALPDCKYPGSVTRCDDLVSVVLNTGESTSFESGGVSYFFNVTGFQVGGTDFVSFLTQEEKDNSAILRGKFTADVGVIPVPAALPLLGSVLVGFGLLKRRERRRAA